MVVGLDKFRAYFAGHEDSYAIIGGSACDIIFDVAGLPFRLTNDIDMVICVEVVGAAFAQVFVDFLKAGGYQAYERSIDQKKQFHRFQKPADPEFPVMIELFSRTPEGFNLPEGAWLAPVPVEDDAASLSAILLDGEYFSALQAFKRVEDGVSILDERLLIPFKGKAYLNLSSDKASGQNVDQGKIDKHMRDVFRLLQLLSPDERIDLPTAIRADLSSFADSVGATNFNPKNIKLPFDQAGGLGLLRSIYSL